DLLSLHDALPIWRNAGLDKSSPRFRLIVAWSTWKRLGILSDALPMKILALEFSSAQRSVALVVDGQVRGRAQETGTRESRALSLIESALSAAGLERETVDCLAVGLGPGSYGGIRSAIALAQGWQLARGTKTLGISSGES